MKLKVPKIAVALFGWILMSGISTMSFRPATSDSILERMSALRLLASHALVELLLLSILFYTQWERIKKRMAQGLFFLGLIHSIYLLGDIFLPFRLPHPMEADLDTIGLLGNKSIGATFSVIWIFFALHQMDLFGKANRKYVIGATGIGFLSVILAKSSISYVALLAGIGAGALSFGIGIRLYTIVCAMIAAGFCLGRFIKPQFFDHISRYDAWPMFYNYIGSQANLIFGAGLGSFKYFGPETQVANKFMLDRGWWLWAHNDWLQIILELGWIGFGLSVLTYLVLLKKSFDRPLLFAAVATYGVTMIGNYNLHIAATSLIGWWLASETCASGFGFDHYGDHNNSHDGPGFLPNN